MTEQLIEVATDVIVQNVCDDAVPEFIEMSGANGYGLVMLQNIVGHWVAQ